MALPKTPRVISGVTSDVRARRYPRALLVAVVSWLVVGILVLFSTVGAPTPSNENRATQDAIDNLNTTQIRAPTGESSWWFPYLPVLGALIVIAALVLAFGRGWARLALAALGLVAVVALAQSAQWITIPVAVFFVVGCVCGLTLSAHRYLRDGASGSSGAAPAGAGERVQ